MSQIETERPSSKQAPASETEESLRAEIADLRRQLNEKKPADQNDALSHARHPASRTLLLLLIGAIAVVAIAFAAGYFPRNRRQNEIVAEARAETQALPVMSVTPAVFSPKVSELSLPANIQAVTEAPILARADGYLKKRYVDIGDSVKAGQLLAEIEAPELDQQVNQARATVEQLRAGIEQAKAAYEQGRVNQNLARVTAERWNNLLAKGAVSRQENDQLQAQYHAQTANVEALDRGRVAAEKTLAASQANLERLIQLQGYKQVRSPFAGVITLRNVDVGALITGGQTLIFRVAQTNNLRAYINVPQSESRGLQVGSAATLEVVQFPGRKFEGKVVRTASSLDPTSRTLLTEVALPNRQGLLLPGMYGQIVLRQTQSHPPLLAPGDTLVVGPNGTQIATVDKGGKIRSKNVAVGRDFGPSVEILQGLEEGDLLVANPNDRVQDGAKVRATAPAPVKAK